MKRLTRHLAALLAAACLLQPLSALAAEEPPDAPSPWAAESVAQAIALGFVPELSQWGYQRDITRKEFAEISLRFLAAQYNYYDTGKADVETFLSRFPASAAGAEKLALTKADCFALVPEEHRQVRGGTLEEWDWNSLLHWMEPFSDLSSDEGLYFINSAYLLGIINGRTDGTFGPDDPITRQEAACMLERTYRLYAGEEAVPDAETLSSFSDRESIGTWAESSVALMVQSGVMDGVGEGAFSPTTGYTREQCYTTFLRLYNNMPTGRVKGNVEKLYTREEELAALSPGGFCVSVDVCFENETAAVALAYYGGLPHGDSYYRFFICYEKGGVRVAPAPWVDKASFRPSENGKDPIYKSGYEEYRLDLDTGESILLTPAP